MTDDRAGGVRVGVTRPAEDQGGLADALTRHGFHPVALPLMARHPVEGARVPDDRFDLLLLTSPAAARRAGDLLAQRDVPPIACVGTATARAARAAFPSARLATPEVATGDALLTVLGDLSDSRVLWIRGTHTTPSTRDALRRSGAQVTPVRAYTTEIDAERARHRVPSVLPLHLVTLTSPRIARAWSAVIASVPPLAPVPVVCIGPTTAAAARSLGLPVAAVATPHNAEGLVRACVRWRDG